MKLHALKSRLAVAPVTRVGAVIAASSWRGDKQASSTQRGYGYKWQQARAAYLCAHPFCVYCLREAGIKATEMADVILECAEAGVAPPYASVVDHCIAHRGDMTLFWDKSNWQSMCTPHHSGEKQREEHQEQRYGGR